MLSGENNGNGWSYGTEAEATAKMTDDATSSDTVFQEANDDTFQQIFNEFAVIERELKNGNKQQAVAKLVNSLESLTYSAGVISRLVDEVIVHPEEE